MNSIGINTVRKPDFIRFYLFVGYLMNCAIQLSQPSVEIQRYWVLILTSIITPTHNIFAQYYW